MFRRFGECHCRVLIHLQDEIARLENSLFELDKDDSNTIYLEYRLKGGEHKEGWDPAQRNILKELREKLLLYGRLRNPTAFSRI